MVSSSFDRFSGLGPSAEPSLAQKVTEPRLTGLDELVVAAREGSTQAEEALYRRFAPEVLRVASRLLGTRDEAADIMQDTFVTVFEDLRQLRDPSAFRGWVMQIAVRLVYRRFRRRKLARFLGFGQNASPSDEGFEAVAHVEAGAEARTELRLIDGALRKLDSDDRVAWLLRHVEGFELLEVSQMMGCSLATTKRKLARAEHAVSVFRGEDSSPVRVPMPPKAVEA